MWNFVIPRCIHESHFRVLRLPFGCRCFAKWHELSNRAPIIFHGDRIFHGDSIFHGDKHMVCFFVVTFILASLILLPASPFLFQVVQCYRKCSLHPFGTLSGGAPLRKCVSGSAAALLGPFCGFLSTSASLFLILMAQCCQRYSM